MLKLERIYTKPFDMNGYRILVDRLWCRGISKKDARLDRWAKGIAPSNQLRKWFQHVDAKFPGFKIRYLNELDHNPMMHKFIRLVKDHLPKTNVILLYSAKNTVHNNAVVLKDYLSRKLNLNQSVNHSFVNFLYNDGITNRSKKLTSDVNYLRNRSTIIKALNLRIKGTNRIYQKSDRKSLDHQALMQIAQNKD